VLVLLRILEDSLKHAYQFICTIALETQYAETSFILLAFDPFTPSLVLFT